MRYNIGMLFGLLTRKHGEYKQFYKLEVKVETNNLINAAKN